MKKIIILMLALTMVFALSVAVSAMSVIELGDDVVLTQGSGIQTVVMPIKTSVDWEDYGCGVLNSEIYLAYSEGMVLKGAAAGDGWSESVLTPGGDLTANPYKLFFDAMEYDYTCGTIAEVSFDVSTAVAGTYEVVVGGGNSYVTEEYEGKTGVDAATFTITVEEADVAPITGAGMNLLLDGGIGVKVFIGYDETVDADALTVDAAINGTTSVETELVFDDVLVNTAYFVVNVAPKDIDNSVISATVSDGVNSTTLTGINVPDCIDKYIADTDEKLSALASALKVYCAQADSYFGDKSADLLVIDNKEKRPLKALVPKSLAEADKVVGDLKFESTSLILNDKVTLRHYFAMANGANINDYTVTGGTVGTTGNYAYVEIANINADALGTAQTITVAKGGESVTVTFSPLNYVGLNYANAQDTALASLVLALYRYNVAAVAY